MKLSVVEIVIQCVAVFLLAPLGAILLVNSPDVLNVTLYWLGVVVVFEVCFFVVRWFLRRKS